MEIVKQMLYPKNRTNFSVGVLCRLNNLLLQNKLKSIRVFFPVLTIIWRNAIPVTANVRFKLLRNLQNEKLADKNSLKQFLWIELA